MHWLYAKEEPNVRYYERGRQAVRESLKRRKFDVKQLFMPISKKRKNEMTPGEVKNLGQVLHQANHVYGPN